MNPDILKDTWSKCLWNRNTAWNSVVRMRYYYRSAPSTHCSCHLVAWEQYNTCACGSDACRGAWLWIRTLDRITRSGFPKSLISRISGPPSESENNRSVEIKNPDPLLESNNGLRVGRHGFYLSRHCDILIVLYIG